MGIEICTEMFMGEDMMTSYYTDLLTWQGALIITKQGEMIGCTA